MNKIKLTLAFLCIAVFSALPALADNYQYLWNKTTAEEETVTDWPSLPSNGVNYADIPFVLQSNGKDFFRFFGYEKNYCSAYAGEACSNEHAIVEITGCNARVSAADRHLRVDLDSGTYNWLTPFGMTWKNNPAVDILRTDHVSFDRTTFAVHGATTYWPTVRFPGTALVEDRFLLDGGTHTIGGDFAMPYRNADFYKSTASTYRFDVTNKASVTLGGTLQIGSNSPSNLYGDTREKDIYFTVTDGSTLTLNGSVQQCVAGRQHILIADSTVVNGEKLQFGPRDATAAANITTDTLITNTTYQMAGLNVYSGNVRFMDSILDTSSGFIHLGWFAGAQTTVDFIDCQTSFSNTSNWHEWPRSTGSCDLNISGGTFSVKSAYAAGDLADNATGTVTVVENADVTFLTLRLGARWGGLGTLNVRSGTVTGSFELGGRNNNGTILGGVGVINLSGGEIKSSGMVMGNSAVVTDARYASFPGTNLVHVTGGVFADTATKVANVGNFVVCQNAAARPSRIALDGGEMRVNKLYGGGGAQVNGGSSWAAFEADGGKLVAPFAASTLLYGFDEAALGERGLTVVSDLGCTIAQNFSNKPGANGRLILSGKGVKTLSGQDSRESVIVVADGTVTFDAAARHYSDVVVTNGAAVNFAGVSGSGMIGDLTLGDATTKGQLVVAKDVPVVVSGNLIVNHALFALGDGFALGTTSTVFSVPNGVPDAVIDALNDSSVSGLPMGAAFEFVRDTDDPTLVKIVVREAVVTVVKATEGRVTDSNEYKYLTADSLIGEVSAGADLTFSGKLSKGNFAKQGAGTAYLTNEANRFLGSVCLYEGRLSVSSMLALGFDPGGTGAFYLRGGTLELADEADPAAVFPYTLTSDPEGANAPVVIKTDAPTVVKSFQQTSGAIFKRGKAPLIFCPDADVVWTGGKGNADDMKFYNYAVESAAGWPFDDDNGVLPGEGDYYTAFNVVEGDVVFTSPGETRVAYDFRKSIRIGVPTQVRSKDAPDARVVIDHASVTVGNNANRAITSLGASMNADNSAFTTATLVLTNNAVLHGFNIAGNCFSSCTSRIDVIDSVLEAESGFEPVRSTVNMRNSALYAPKVDMSGNSTLGAICARGSSTFNLDGSVMAKNASGEPFEFYTCYDKQTVHCANGSRFCCNRICWFDSDLVTAGNVFTFDNSEWYPGAANFEFNDATAGTQPQISVTGKGLILAPPENCTYTFGKTISGAGGLVKRGAGTLVMPMTNLVATGEIAVEAGTLDLDGTTATGRTFSGSGAIRNGALETPVIKVTQGGAGFDLGTITPTGRVYVDFSAYGDEVPLGTAIPVARVSGSIDLSKWRGKNLGTTGVKATFAVQDGVVLATVDHVGLLLMVR